MDPRGVLRISSDGDDRMGAKVQDPKKSLDQKLTPKKSHAKFLTLKILNIKTLEIESCSYFKCHCQRKPGRGHGSRSADSFEIPTTDYLSDMIVKYSLFNLIDDFSCEFDNPPCFWLICIRLPSQFGVTCTSYFSYLLLVFSAVLIYLDYLRFDPIVFM